MTRDREPPGTAVECKSCHAMIVWTRTERRKAMPCDVAPSPKGTFFLFRRADCIEAIYHTSKHASAAKARERGQAKHEAHWATCVTASQHRKS